MNNFTLDKQGIVWYIIVTMNELEQFKEDAAMDFFGRSPQLAKAANQCVKCGEFNLKFRDELSRKEYGISGFCQCCQDEIFG